MDYIIKQDRGVWVIQLLNADGSKGCKHRFSSKRNLLAWLSER